MQTFGATSVGKPTADAGTNEYAEGLALQKWEKELKMGKIEYNPADEDVAAGCNDGECGGARVRRCQRSGPRRPVGIAEVSQRMRVELSAEENPNEFKIEPVGTEDVQLVPIDGTARWQWQVTPKEPATDQTDDSSVTDLPERSGQGGR